MYEYCPKRENNKAIHLIFLMLIGGFLLLALTAALPALPFRWVFQLLGIACLAVAIYTYTRYITRRFSYAVVQKSDGTYDLTVTEWQRKSRVTVCRLSLDGIERVERVEYADRDRRDALKKELRATGRKTFYYTVNLMPQSLCYVIATECGEPLAVIIEPDERLMEMLTPPN